MEALKTFWRFLESRPRAVAVMREWQGLARDGFCVVEPLLHPRDETLFTFPNPDPFGMPLTIVHHQDGQIVAVDREDPSYRLELEAEDVVPYELHLPALRRAIRGPLGLETARTTVPPSTRDVLLGYWEPQKAARFPVRLLLPYGRRQLEELVHRRIAAGGSTGEILLTPTRRLWDQQLLETEHRPKMLPKILLAPLSEVLAANGNGLDATESWEEYLRAFCQMVRATFPSSYLRKRPRKRAERAVKIERIRQALVDHFRSARDHAFSTAQHGDGAALLPRPSKTMLAKMASVRPHDITRCFRDDPQLVSLHEMADNLDDVMRFGR